MKKSKTVKSTWRFEDDDGNVYPCGYIDGYSFGGRSLDGGIYFKVTIEPGNVLKVHWPDPSYVHFDFLKRFNQEYYLDLAYGILSSNDIFAATDTGSGDLAIVDNVTMEISPQCEIKA